MYESRSISLDPPHEIIVFATDNEGALAADLLSQMTPAANITLVTLDPDLQAMSQTSSVHSWENGVAQLLIDSPMSGHRLIQGLNPVISTATHYTQWGETSPFYLGTDCQIAFVTDPTNGVNRLSEHIYRDTTTEYTTRGSEIARQDLLALTDTQDESTTYYPMGDLHIDSDTLDQLIDTRLEQPQSHMSVDTGAEITAVDTDAGAITAVTVGQRRYTSDTYDLFVDATGKSEQLLSTVTTAERAPSLTLPFDTALYATRRHESDTPTTATVLSTTDHGVVRQTDSRDLREFVFIYSASHTETEDAEMELAQFITDSDSELSEETLTHTHTPVSRTTVAVPWTGNCVGIGSTHTRTLPLQSHRYTQMYSDVKKISSLITQTGAVSTAGNAALYTESVNAEQDGRTAHTALALDAVNTETPVWDRVSDATELDSFTLSRQYLRDGFARPTMDQPLEHALTCQVDSVGQLPVSSTDSFRTQVLVSLLGHDIEYYEQLDHQTPESLAEAIQSSRPDPESIADAYMTYDNFNPGSDDDQEIPDTEETGTDKSEDEIDETGGWRSF